MIKNLAEAHLKTLHGEFREILFYDGQRESFALVMGNIEEGEDVLCRIHSSCIFGHHFNSIECDCRDQFAAAQKKIQQQGRGIIVWLEQEGKGNGHYALLKSIPFKKEGMSQAEAYEAAGFKKDARDYHAAAAILQYLNVKSVKMLTDNPSKTETLTRLGIRVSGIEKL